MPDTLPGAARRPSRGFELLRLSRRDRAEARRRLADLTPQAQADACRELRPEVRAEFCGLLESPEQIVPLLPEAELVHSVLAGGMSEAAWLLELATPEQRLACFDLDCWHGEELQLERVDEWLDALVEAGRPTLARALGELDLELVLLSLWRETRVVVIDREDDPPDGFFSPDGMVYFEVGDEGSTHRVHEIAHATHSQDSPLYWRIVYGLLFETRTECEENALRWHARRLNDLGFPERSDAMLVYRPLPPEQVEDFGRAELSSGVAVAHDLPRQFGGTLLAEALAELPPASASDALGQVLAVANWLAVADRLRLSESESIPTALGKAVRGIDGGLRELVRRRNQPPAEVLARTRAIDLFRAGATLDLELRGPYR